MEGEATESREIEKNTKYKTTYKKKVVGVFRTMN